MTYGGKSKDPQQYTADLCCLGGQADQPNRVDQNLELPLPAMSDSAFSIIFFTIYPPTYPF